MDNEIRKYCEQCKFYSALGCQSTLICTNGNKFWAADVQPVRHGRWIEETPKHSRCSCCDVTCLIAVYPISANANFCPNCGADMRGDTNG